MKANVALVSEHSSAIYAQENAANSKVLLHGFRSLAEALKARKQMQFEAFIIDERKLTKNAVARLSKFESNISIVVLLESARKPQNSSYWKNLNPLFFWSQSESFSQFQNQLENACNLTRKSLRLNVLRQHQARSLNLTNNPALELISDLIHKCSRSNDYHSIVDSALVLSAAIEFHECHLLVCSPSEEAQVFSFLGKNTALRQQLLKDAPTQALARLPISSNSAALILRDQSAGEILNGFLTQPWNSAVIMKFPVFSAAPAANKKGVNYLVFVRTDLMTFTEKDRWLLEIAYGPIAVSLEKIHLLQILGSRGREWRSTFDAISEPISVIDGDYRIHRANRAFAEAIGADIRTVKRKHCFTIFARRKRPCISCPIAKSTKSHGGARIKGKKGRDYLVWSYPLPLDKIGLRIQFYRDVSKEAQLSAALIQSEKMAALGSLISAIAHEINNPLAGILATSQLLLSSPEENSLTESAQDDLREIEAAARRSKEIIDNLLGFSGESRQGTLLLSDAVRSVLLFAKTALKHVRVEQSIAFDPAIRAVNASFLQQILFNLITNAAHAMESSGSLQIHSEYSGPHLKIEVRDSGKGISKENLEKIFEPFFTEKKEGRGTGLGLSIVRTLTARLGGMIEVQSELGKGTNFSLLIPLEPAKEPS